MPTFKLVQITYEIAFQNWKQGFCPIRIHLEKSTAFVTARIFNEIMGKYNKCTKRFNEWCMPLSKFQYFVCNNFF